MSKKPKKCPQCGAARIAKILYGMPDFSPKLEKDLDEGKIVLGGCVITGQDPSWECVKCKTRFYDDLTPALNNDDL